MATQEKTRIRVPDDRINTGDYEYHPIEGNLGVLYEFGREKSRVSLLSLCNGLVEERSLPSNLPANSWRSNRRHIKHLLTTHIKIAIDYNKSRFERYLSTQN